MNRKERRAAAKQERTGQGRTTSAAQMAKIEKAIALAQAGDLAGAETILEALNKSDADQPEVNHQLGMIHARTGRTDTGLVLLRRAVELRPEESLYWNNLAAACLAIERSRALRARRPFQASAGNPAVARSALISVKRCRSASLALPRESAPGGLPESTGRCGVGEPFFGEHAATNRKTVIATCTISTIPRSTPPPASTHAVERFLRDAYGA